MGHNLSANQIDHLAALARQSDGTGVVPAITYGALSKLGLLTRVEGAGRGLVRAKITDEGRKAIPSA
jgi:hypothetical protein